MCDERINGDDGARVSGAPKDVACSCYGVDNVRDRISTAIDQFVADRDSGEGGPGVFCCGDEGLEIALEVVQTENPSEYFLVVGLSGV